jgi:hypothetical protein
MPIPVQIVLAVGPLAFYFLVLGAWQSGRRPKVVSGVVDFGFLAFGLGAIIAFGPIGRVLVRYLFPGESVWAWLALPAMVALVALLWAPKTHRRVVVYNVNRQEIEQAARDLAGSFGGGFVATLRGYEDTVGGRGFSLECAKVARTAVFETYGKESEALARAIVLALRERLFGFRPASPQIARFWFALSAIVIWVPMLIAVLTQPRVRATFRAVMQMLHGG